MVRHLPGSNPYPVCWWPMHFSQRTAWEPGENDWARAVREARASGRDLIDLTVANPTACGLGPEDLNVLAPLAHAGALRYTPDPLGMRVAREAVARYYRDHGAEVSPERICLTTSTSEAYSFLFRLLCDAGDEILIARPSYPLFDLLAQLDDVILREYPLLYDPGARALEAGGWVIDLHALEAAITSRTRAIVAVHPNNPTGNYVGVEERAALRRLCAQRGLALIVDEVFLDYASGMPDGRSDMHRSFTAEPSECLCFVLSGLSKICALPQMKLSWIAVSGPAEITARAMERIEIIADTFLSVNAPTQFALSDWLGAREGTQRRIRQRLGENLALLDRALHGSQGSRLATEGGWTAVLRVPSAIEGDDFSIAAIDRGAVVQPGEFYGLPKGRCVLSLLTEPETLCRGLERLPLQPD